MQREVNNESVRKIELGGGGGGKSERSEARTFIFQNNQREIKIAKDREANEL